MLEIRLNHTALPWFNQAAGAQNRITPCCICTRTTALFLEIWESHRHLQVWAMLTLYELSTCIDGILTMCLYLCAEFEHCSWRLCCMSDSKLLPKHPLRQNKNGNVPCNEWQWFTLVLIYFLKSNKMLNAKPKLSLCSSLSTSPNEH